MRVALNAQLLTRSRSYRSAGVSQYIYHLLRHLPLVDEHNSYLVYANRTAQMEELLGAPNLAARITALPTVRPPIRILWEQALQPFALTRDRVDLVHAAVNVLPLWLPVPGVVTVHDLAFMRYPRRFSRAKRLYLDLFTRHAARRARRIIADSAHTKADLVSMVGAAPERVDVVYPGVAEDFRPPDAEALRAFREQHELPEHFVLFIGTLEPRKNLPRLVEAFARVRRSFDCALVVGGARGWMYSDLFRRVDELGLRSCVRFTGFLDAAALPLWYGAADVFVYPSLYEGFGLPPLEAMACGTAVVASNVSSLPEVVGDAGLLVDPLDANAIAEAICTVIADSGLRAQLGIAGQERARRFSWQETARQTVAVYERAMG